jgi:protein TonB
VNYEARALQLSFAVHISAIILFIAANYFFATEKKFPVIDFTLIDLVQSAGNKDSPAIAGRKTSHTRPKEETIGKKPRISYSKSEAESIRPEPVISRPEPENLLSLGHDISQSAALSDSKADMQLQDASDSGKDTGPEKNDMQDITGKVAANNTLSAGGSVQSASFDTSGNSHGAKRMTYLKANFSYIRDLINRKLTYPLMARQRGWEGKVKVSFTISRDGFVKDIMIIESSGIEVLDNNAVKAVKNASPYPRPPVAAQIIIPINYELR